MILIKLHCCCIAPFAAGRKDCHLHRSRFHLLFAISWPVVLAIDAAAGEVQRHSDQQDEGDGLQRVAPVSKHTCSIHSAARQMQRCSIKTPVLLPCAALSSSNPVVPFYNTILPWTDRVGQHKQPTAAIRLSNIAWGCSGICCMQSVRVRWRTLDPAGDGEDGDVPQQVRHHSAQAGREGPQVRGHRPHRDRNCNTAQGAFLGLCTNLLLASPHPCYAPTPICPGTCVGLCMRLHQRHWS